MERITATELQRIITERNEAEAKATESWHKKCQAQKARDKAIKDLPEQVAFLVAEERWYELQSKADELDQEWQKAVAAMTEGAA